MAENPDVEWSMISKKLISNYRSTRSSIEANVKITKLQMMEEEMVGEYLACARTVIKAKLKDQLQWHSEYNNTDAFHMCNRISKPRLKSHMLSRVHKYRT